VLGDKLFMTTLDAHLITLDMKTGAVAWDVTLDDYKPYCRRSLLVVRTRSSSALPAAIGIRAFIDAYDARRASARGASTVPAPGRPVTTRGRVIRGRPKPASGTGA
jgi:alcohol dehydrogenase (cytochrome c)